MNTLSIIIYILLPFVSISKTFTLGSEIATARSEIATAGSEIATAGSETLANALISRNQQLANNLPLPNT